ncbi:hypothetical protein Tco_1023446 [Tanacetum coccineum]
MDENTKCRRQQLAHEVEEVWIGWLRKWKNRASTSDQGSGGIDEQGGQVGCQGNHRGCSYKEFLACNPKEYNRKGGAIVYTHWIEKMESVQDMSGCGDNQKVKYNAGSFVGKALTWWNSQIHTQSREIAVGMTWEDFKTLMSEEFCSINEMQKLETEFWNHAMVGVAMLHILIGFMSWLGMVAATEPTTIQKAVQKAGTCNTPKIW